nr:hypothetical protein CFP56_03640 [Quercus suber]
MVLEEKMSDLLALLTAHIGGNALVVLVVPRPSTPISPHPSVIEAIGKKRKMRKQTRKESSEEGEIPLSIQQPPSKKLRITRAQQKKGLSEGASKST